MGRMYAVAFEEVAVTAAQDLIEIGAAAAKCVVLHSVVITQSSDSGDTEAEHLPVLFHRNTASGSGGSTVTARPLDPGDAAYSGTAEANNTTQATEGNQVHAEAMNVAVGLHYRPTPEERITLGGGDFLAIELQAAPSDSLTVSGTAIIEEIG